MAVTGRILLNAHTPHFTTPPLEHDIASLVDARLAQYEWLRMAQTYAFTTDREQESLLQEKLTSLIQKGAIIRTEGVQRLDLGLLKATIREKNADISFYPDHYTEQFQQYLHLENENPAIASEKTVFGVKLEDGKYLHPILEQALYPTFFAGEKVIISGPNVLAPYTFRAALLAAYDSDAPIHVVVHSLLRGEHDTKIRKSEMEFEGLIRALPPGIPAQSYLRLLAMSYVTKRKTRSLQKSEMEKTVALLKRFHRAFGENTLPETHHHPSSLSEIIKETIGLVPDLASRLGTWAPGDTEQRTHDLRRVLHILGKEKVT